MKLKILLTILFVSTAVFASRNQFLSRDFIDTTIQNTYYLFVAANKEAGGSTQIAAIERAKGIVANMKQLAENDPNRRYILWRLSELEAQIGLEEEEVRLKQQHARVRQINELVDMFNREFLVPRPNFANLHALYERMIVVDTRKTNEFADLINQKNRSVTQNLRQAINSALENNNFRQAETEFNYAVANRRFINLSDTEIENWRRRIQARKDADYLRENIDNRVALVNGIASQNRLLEAKRHIEVLNNDLNGARALLTQNFVSSTRMKLNNLSANIDRREDSLIQHGFALVNTKRYNEASDFLRNVLFPAGVDRSRIAGIDRAIIEAEGGQRQHVYESSVVIANSEESGAALNEAMRARARVRADSMRLVNEYEERKSLEHFERRNKALIKKHTSDRNKQTKLRNQCDDFLRNILMMFEQGRGSAAVKQFHRRQAVCFANATPKLYHDVKERVNRQTGANDREDGELIAMRKKHEAEKPEAKQMRAGEIIGEIYDLVERKQVSAAYSLYYFNRPLLTEHAYPEALTAVKRMLVRAYAREMGISRQ